MYGTGVIKQFLIRLIAYPSIVLVAVAYGLSAYSIYAHVMQTWSSDDPRMILPGSGLLGLVGGGLLGVVGFWFRKQMSKLEDIGVLVAATCGVALLPASIIVSLVLDK